jgi:hypothetical protein
MAGAIALHLSEIFVRYGEKALTKSVRSINIESD